jgi:hypothetical protein
MATPYPTGSIGQAATPRAGLLMCSARGYIRLGQKRTFAVYEPLSALNPPSKPAGQHQLISWNGEERHEFVARR